MATVSKTLSSGTPMPTRLLNKNFVLLWQGQFVSRIGSQVYAIAIVLWLKDATGSATLVGVIMMLSALPNVLLSAIGGTAADRLSRRRIIIWSDVIRGLLVLSVAVVLFLAPEASSTTIWLVAVAASMSATTAFFVPAISAAIPDLVPREKLIQANSLRQLTAQTALMAGQAVGGVLYRVLGAPVLALVNGVSFLVSAAAEAFVRIPERSPDAAGARSATGFGRDFIDGLRYVWRQEGLRQIFLFSGIFAFFTTPIVVLLPFYVDDFLGASPDWYGYLLAAYTGGIMLGSIATGAVRVPGATRARLMIAFAISSSFAVGMLGFVRDLEAALVLAPLIGAMTGFNGINVYSITQAKVGSEMRGRVQGLLATATGALAPIGMGAGGVVYDVLGGNITLIFGACGASMAVLSIAVSSNAAFRAFIGHDAAPAHIERDERLKQPST